jgi:hypothetical protein
MKRIVSLTAVLGLALLTPALTEAATIFLTPESPGIVGQTLDPANCEPECLEDALGVDAGVLLYKSDQGGGDSGTFAGSYDTEYFNTPGDPEDATISYTGGASISCPACYLAIKDGNSSPNWYFYDLAAWDGISDIVMTGFFPGKGAISHVSIWGNPEEEGGGEEEGATVPEPASLLLFGLGVAATAARLRRKTNS